MPTNAYGNFLVKLANKEIDLDSDAIKAMLTTSAYTPNLDTHAYKSDVTSEVVGTGYVAGGTAVTLTPAYTAANSWGISRANATVYPQGAIVRPATGNGFVYMAIVAGTSGGSIPTYPTTYGGTVTDGTVTWMCAGRGVFWVDSTDPTWPGSTITARRIVWYDSTPGTDATRPLIAVSDQGSDVATTNGAWTGQVDPAGIFTLPIQ
jgi:hypothetical protein